VKKLIKQSGILSLMAFVFIMTACNMGMIQKPPIPDYNYGNGPSVQPDGGGVLPALSSNANIREVQGHGTTDAKYGFYMAGLPGIVNEGPQDNPNEFFDDTETMIVNATLAAIERSIVVIVEDEKVSSVEFGQNSGADTVNSEPPDSWITLTRNNDNATPDTQNKRWVGSVSGAPTGTKTRLFVKITAEDGTVQYYSYVQHYSTSSSGGTNMGELSSLMIGEKNVITGGSVVSPSTKGTFAGWWNKTVAPNFEPGQVVLSAVGNITLSAVFNNNEGLSTTYAKVPAADWPLKENSVVNFNAPVNGMNLSAAVHVANGDYIIVRMNAHVSDSVYSSFYNHYIIQVLLPNTLTITYNAGGGTGSGPTSPTQAKLGETVTMPANTYTNAGKYFAGWAVSGTGSKPGTYPAGAVVSVSDLSTAIAGGSASITLTATWSATPPSSNANIREVSGSGVSQKYGFYVGGMPGTSNGTARSDEIGFTSTTLTMSGNGATWDPDKKAVVIVEDAKVQKVEFAFTDFISGTSPSAANLNLSGTVNWTTMDKDNTYTTPDTKDKRWTKAIGGSAPSTSSSRAIYVRITAEDGTQQVYRYVQYISTTKTNTVTRGELSDLSIGGVAVITSGAVQGSFSKGIAQGWWNKTAAPDFEPGHVTITAAQAASCAVSAKANNGNTSSVSIAKISASDWPLLDNSTLTIAGTGSSSTQASATATITDVKNGDYILVRHNANTSDTTYGGLFLHTIIKVTVTP